jgi:hypothetical protein
MYTLSTPPPCVEDHNWPEDSYQHQEKAPSADIRRCYHLAKNLISTLKQDYAKNRAIRRRVRYYLHSAHRPVVFAKSDVCTTVAAPAVNVESRFRQLATEWKNETGNVSSLTALIAHPKYREIVKLDWEVVPFLLRDLQDNHGFWFPALREITNITPFDPSDEGNSKRMTKAWIQWGKKKRFI